MKRIILSVLLACIACGGGGDEIDASRFVGLWNGTTTATVGSQSATTTGYTHISANGAELHVGDVCANGDGPSASVTGPNTFTVHGYTCPASATSTCGSVVLQITSGNGALSGSTLNLSGVGTITGCGSSFPFAMSFSGTR
jgi:hypothetical protein